MDTCLGGKIWVTSMRSWRQTGHCHNEEPVRHLGEFSNLLTGTLSEFWIRIQAGANGGTPPSAKS